MSDPAAAPPVKRRRPVRETPKPKTPKPPRNRQRVDEAAIELVASRARKGKGDGPEGEYWEIRAAGRRVGEVFVNVVDELPLGRHASLQIYLLKTEQGRGIGRIAYRLAADTSRHDTIHLHMRKSNPASRIAAEAAGFADVTPPEIRQLILKRDRLRG